VGGRSTAPFPPRTEPGSGPGSITDPAIDCSILVGTDLSAGGRVAHHRRHTSRRFPEGRQGLCRLKGWQGPSGARLQSYARRSATMGKGNNSQKNDKKAMKPKQDKTKAVKK